MDQTTSISSSPYHDETGMEQVQSDLQALKRLYGLLHKGPKDENLDETSRALLMRMLDDATQQTLLKQRKVICFDAAKKMDQSTSISSSHNHDETGMEQVQSDLLALKRLYGLLHKGPADENFDETSRDLLMSMLDDATQQTLLRQAKMLSGSLMSPALSRNLSIRSDRRTFDAGPRLNLNPLASPSLSLQPSVRSRRLNMQNSKLSSRDGRHVHGHRHAEDEPALARLASNRSSRTAMPPGYHPSREQRHSGLSLYRLPVAATSQHGTVTGSTRHAVHRDRTRRRGSGRGDQSSPELSLERARHIGAEGSSSTRHLGRLGSGLSLGMASRRVSERAGRGAATPRYASSTSSNEAVTIRSRIRPHRELMDRRLRRAKEDEDESTPRRWRKDGAVSSAVWSSIRRPRRTPKLIDSGSNTPGAANSVPSTSLTVQSAYSASASSYSSPVSRRGSARPAYASVASESLRSRRRRERKERREGRLRKLKDKIAMVFHLRHDHHHHHHLYGRGQEGPSRSERRAYSRGSPWRFVGGLFHHTKGQERKTTSRTGVSVPAKRRGGGGGWHIHALFDAMRHLLRKRRAPASVRMRRKGSRLQVKKLHWWQRLRQRRGRAGKAVGSRPRRRLEHGKAV